MIDRPDPSEYFDYYDLYVRQVPDGDVLEILERGVGLTRRVLERVPADRESFRYGPGKWSFREVVGHLIDSERLFTFRSLHIARGDPAPLPGIDQDHWGRGSDAGERSLTDLLAELEAVRSSGLHLFRSFSAAALDRTGDASGHRFSVRAFPWIVAGHEIHHRTILEERYLPALEAA